MKINDYKFPLILAIVIMIGVPTFCLSIKYSKKVDANNKFQSFKEKYIGANPIDKVLLLNETNLSPLLIGRTEGELFEIFGQPHRNRLNPKLKDNIMEDWIFNQGHFYYYGPDEAPYMYLIKFHCKVDPHTQKKRIKRITRGSASLPWR